MIHHEVWYQITANSREAQEAIERLKRGDDSALRDIWILGERGALEGVPPDFLINIMQDRHGGKSKEWMRIVSKEHTPYHNNPNHHLNPFNRLNVTQASHWWKDLLSVSFKYTEGTQMMKDSSWETFKFIWDSLDAEYRQLDWEWSNLQQKHPEAYAEFLRKYPRFRDVI